MKIRHIILASALVAAPFARAGTDSSPSQSPEPANVALTNTIWSVDRFEREFCGEDIWEPFNRAMFGIFDIGMTYVVDPFCYLYSSIIPKPLIKGIDNFGENLEYPKRLVSNLLIAEWGTSWDETRRFLINSTLGIGGLFDPADEWFYIFDSDASLSDTAACWGIPAGPPLALPFLPRASIRGHVTYILDYGLDAKTYFDYICPSGIFIGWSWCLTPNKAPVWRGAWESLSYHTADPYSVYMPLAAGMNEFNIRQYAWHYFEGQYERSYTRLQAKALPVDSFERAALEAEAETHFRDVRPPVRAQNPRPEGLKGRWRTIPGYAPRTPALDSIRALAFAPLGDDDFWWERRSIFNRDFSKGIETRSVEISTNLPLAKFSFVPAPSDRPDGVPPPLAVIIPGIGSGRTATEAVAMAETLNAEGYAVVIVDSMFHWEYVRSANRGILPGYLAEDVKRLATYLSRILHDLEADGVCRTEDVTLLGWSMGGLSVTHLAALSDAGALPFPVGRFIAINPPASMDHALEPFEAVTEASRNWTKDYVREMFTIAAPSMVGWAAQDHPRYDPDDPPLDAVGDPWNYAPNLTDEQARFLLGMTLRVMFPNLIGQRHREKPFPWIASEYTYFHRNDFYDEVGTVSMREYITCYVPACYEGVKPETMIETANIRRLGATLKGNDRLVVFHTRNDPLLTEEDRAYLDEVLGDRITWFDEGAHCGYFYTKPFRDELFARLAWR